VSVLFRLCIKRLCFPQTQSSHVCDSFGLEGGYYVDIFACSLGV
jgi:hypothetical protein